MERETGLEPGWYRSSPLHSIAIRLFSSQFVSVVAVCFSLSRRESSKSLAPRETGPGPYCCLRNDGFRIPTDQEQEEWKPRPLITDWSRLGASLSSAGEAAGGLGKAAAAKKLLA